MSEQYPGGFISKAPPTPQGNTAISSAYGMWNMSQQAYYQAQGLWPDANNPVDAQFNYVTMLLHADGTNGATNGGSSSSNTPPFNTDASTNAFPISVYGGAQPNNFNPYQGSYYSNYFDGSVYTNYLSYGSSSLFQFGTGDFTVESWIYIAGPSAPTPGGLRYANVASYSNTGGSDGGWQLLIKGDANTTGTGLEFEHWYGSGSVTYVTADATITNNAWHHVAVVRSGTTTSLYLDGTRIGSGTLTQQNITLGTTLGIALRPWDTNYKFPVNGYLSNVRIVKGTAVYTGATYSVPTSPLTAISGTSLLTCQSNGFKDNSGNSLALTVNGTPSVTYNQPFTLPSTYSTYGSGYFDNDGDYLTSTGVVLGTGNVTFEFWIYPFDSTTTYNCVYDTRASGNTSSGFGIFQYGLTIEVYDSALVVASAAGSLKVNAWNHVALVRNSGTCQLYINGVASGSSASNSTNISSTERRIATGSTNTYYYYGYISDLRENSTAVYTTTFTPPTAPLSAISGTQLLTLQTNGAANDSGFIDSSPNDFPITRNGNTTQGSFSPYGSNWSNYFNGSSYLTVANNSAFILGSTWSIEAWVNPSTTQGTQTVAAKWYNATANGSYVLYISNAAIKGGVYPDAFNDSGLYPVENQWNHIVMTSDGTYIRFFLNGQLGTVASGVATNISADNGLPFSIGSNYNATSPLTGYISNVRVTKNAIPTTYQTTSTTFGAQIFTPPTAPLTTSSQGASSVSLLACQSNRFIDNSSNAFALTVGGTPSVQRFNPFGTSTAYSTATIGGSGYFDGTGDYIYSGTGAALNLSTGDYTIECWFYPTSLNASYTSCVQWNPSINNYLGTKTTNATWYDGSIELVGGTIRTNAWNHIAATRSGTSVKLFLNGAVVASGTSSASVGSSTDNVYINTNSGGSYQSGGYYSDVRITKGGALYTSAFTPPTAPLTAVSGTQLLLNMTNAAIYDNAMMNDLETVGNAQISTSVKKYGTGSISLNGSTDYCAIASTPNLQLGSGDFTIESWIYMNSLPASGSRYTIVSKWGATLSYICSLYNNSGTMNIEFAGSTDGNSATTFVDATATSLTATTWLHVAYVRSGGNFYMFVNGVQATSGSTISGTLYNDSQAVNVGRHGSGVNYFNGYIDDLRITKGYARYTANFTPPTAAFPNIGPT